MSRPKKAPGTPGRQSASGVTVHDVAQLAGVSAITVSRALNSPDQLSQGTLERVRAAIRETGYVPNLLARGLNANTSSRLVAMVVPTITGPIFSASVQALSRALARDNYQVMLGQTEYEDAREDALLDAIIGRRPDGIVLTGVMHSEHGRKRLIASGIPVVETWDLSDEPLDMLVGFSHEAVGRAVCDFFHAKGRRKLGILAARDVRAFRRGRAFIERARELGLPNVPESLVQMPGTLAGGREGLARLLREPGGVDAVFCSSDMLGLGALIEAQAQGVQVPEDLALVGFGDLDFAASLTPALSTVRIDAQAIGGQAARFIIDRGRGIAPPSRVVDVGFTLVERASSAV